MADRFKRADAAQPKAPDIAPAELVELGDADARRTGYPIQCQQTLLEGINDTDAKLERASHSLTKGE